MLSVLDQALFVEEMGDGDILGVDKALDDIVQPTGDGSERYYTQKENWRKREGLSHLGSPPPRRYLPTMVAQLSTPMP